MHVVVDSDVQLRIIITAKVKIFPIKSMEGVEALSITNLVAPHFVMRTG